MDFLSFARAYVAPTAASRDATRSWDPALFAALECGGEPLPLVEALAEGGLDPGFTAACAAHLLARRVLTRVGAPVPSGLLALVAGDWTAGFSAIRESGGVLAGEARGVLNAPVADAFVVLTDKGVCVLERAPVLPVAMAVLRTAPTGDVDVSGARAAPVAALDREARGRLLADLQNTERMLVCASWAGLLRGLHALALSHVAADARARAMQSHRIALAEVELAARLCTVTARRDAAGEEIRAAAAAAKLFVASQAQEATRRAMPLFGQAALLEGHPAARLSRDAAALHVRVGDDALTQSTAASALLAGRRLPELPAGQAFAERFRAFCRERVASRAAVTDATGEIPEEVWRDVAGSGYLRFFHPRALGGLELGPEETAIAMETLGGACPSTAWTATISSNLCGRMLARHGSAAHHQRWLQPMMSGEKLACLGIVEAVGSDFSSYVTRATRARGGLVLNGEKATVTNAPAADVGLIFTVTDEGGAVVVVDMKQPGVRTEACAHLGIRGMPWGRIVLSDVAVPEEDVLFRGPRDAVMATLLGFIDWGLLFQSACSVGIAEAALQATLDFQANRPAYGGAMPHLQHVHGRLAEMRAQIDAGRLLTWEAVRLKSAGGEAGRACRLAKIYTSELAVRVCVEAVRLHGSAGIRTTHPAERLLRDSLPPFYAGMSSDVLRDILVAPMVGVDPFVTPSLAWLAEAGFGPAA